MHIVKEKVDHHHIAFNDIAIGKFFKKEGEVGLYLKVAPKFAFNCSEHKLMEDYQLGGLGADFYEMRGKIVLLE